MHGSISKAPGWDIVEEMTLDPKSWRRISSFPFTRLKRVMLAIKENEKKEWTGFYDFIQN